MMHVLLRRRVDEAKWLLASCSLAVICFCWLRVWIVSRVDTSRFQQILELVPGDWQRFMTVDVAWLITYEGRISLAFDELVVIGGISIWAIARGSDCVSGELGRGTLEMLLAQPISRLAAFATQASVTIVGVGVIALSAWFGTWLGIQSFSVKREVMATWQLPIPLPLVGSEVPVPFAQARTQQVAMSELVDVDSFLPAAASLFAFGLMIAGFSTLMSSWDRYRWRTIGIVIGFFFAQTLLKLVGMAIEEWSWLRFLSAFTAYEPEAVVQVACLHPDQAWAFLIPQDDGSWRSGPMTLHTVMGGIGVASYLGALAVFWHRDLPAPL